MKHRKIAAYLVYMSLATKSVFVTGYFGICRVVCGI